MPKMSERQVSHMVVRESYEEDRQQYITRKLAEGYGIYYPEEGEILIDIDNEDDKNHFWMTLDRVQEELSRTGKVSESELPLEVQSWDSKTPGHKHFIVKLPWRLNTYERIALQAVFGSDRVKELLSIFRSWAGDIYPTLLAKPPEE